MGDKQQNEEKQRNDRWEVEFWRTPRVTRAMFCTELLEFGPWEGRGQCLFPVAVVTSYHRLSSLKQNRFIILHFCRLEVWNGFYILKSRCWETRISSEDSRWESISLSFPPSRGCLHSWPMAPSTSKAYHPNLCSDGQITFSHPLTSLLEGSLWWHLSPTWINQNNPELKMLHLLTSAKFLLPQEITYS